MMDVSLYALVFVMNMGKYASLRLVQWQGKTCNNGHKKVSLLLHSPFIIHCLVSHICPLASDVALTSSHHSPTSALGASRRYKGQMGGFEWCCVCTGISYFLRGGWTQQGVDCQDQLRTSHHTSSGVVNMHRSGSGPGWGDTGASSRPFCYFVCSGY